MILILNLEELKQQNPFLFLNNFQTVSKMVETQTNGTNGVNGTTTQENGLKEFTDAAAQEVPSLPTVEKFVSEEYDFVIAGGGTAALCVAARLTEDPNTTVAVIEYGKNKLGDMIVDTPAMFKETFMNPEYDWGLLTTPQVRRAASFGRSH